ncbi:MAG: DUF4956 domain-containing protein [Clostridia bacterium]|nr:DUF4956 domain-containing protein [Clostridia bacterium]
MFTALFNLAEGLTPATAILLMLSAAACGLIIAATAILTGSCTRNFAISLIILPMIIQVVILMVNGNVGTGVAVLGAFSLIRFRSAQGSARDITLIFLAMAVGLATGMAYTGYAFIVTLIACALLILFSRIPMPDAFQPLHLRISIPEDLDYNGLFDDLFSRYTRSHQFEGVKSTNMGSMFELSYEVQMAKPDTEKAFLDEIRCRNGNLTVALTHRASQHETL